jgi:hypothetical protein
MKDERNEIEWEHVRTRHTHTVVDGEAGRPKYAVRAFFNFSVDDDLLHGTTIEDDEDGGQIDSVTRPGPTRIVVHIPMSPSIIFFKQ